MNDNEIEITQLLETDMFEFSHSAAEGGENAGRDTWNAALNGPRPLLTTPEQFENFRDFVKDSGGWTEEEITTWNENELQALFLQWVAGDIREAPALLEGVEFEERPDSLAKTLPDMEWYFQTKEDKEKGLETGPFDSRHEAYKAASDELVGFNRERRAESLEDIDWLEYEAQSSAGQIAGRLFKTDEGKIYFNIGN